MTIWKLKEESSTNSLRKAAGDRQERDVAFYLRRAFKDTEDYIVFNDYSFTFNGENAQIDHLIIHRYGFLVIESKSIYGEVKVNDTAEWARSYKGQWSGIPSPIKQAELQTTLLKEMLTENKKKFLGKALGIQQSVRGRKWNVLCAVSNSCILHRDNIPKAVNKSVIKSEGVAEAVKAIGGKNIVGKVFGSEPLFSDDEMISIANFLYSQAINIKEASDTPSLEPKAPTRSKEPAKAKAKAPVQAKEPDKPNVAPQVEPTKKASSVFCKKCGETEELDDLYGQYGYYVKCRKCSTNTSMKQACSLCGNKKVKLSKKKQDYFLGCECSEPYVIFSKK